jgi:hypothetical protein
MVCVAAYLFLAAYAYYGMQQGQLEAKQIRLSALTDRQRDLLRKRDLLEKVRLFSDQVSGLKLNRQEWLFYDVNVQGEFEYEAAQLIIQQCSDSDLAYYWPIALEIKTTDKVGGRAQPAPVKPDQSDVQLTVKGKFVARK